MEDQPFVIRKASLMDIDPLASLFDQYRQFYQQTTDLAGAFAFLKSRLENEESILFIAQLSSGESVGFCQLYPNYSSINMSHTWVFNDLFVLPASRRMGIAAGLLEAAQRFSLASGAHSLSLETGKDNVSAQALYEKYGFKRSEGFYNYSLTLRH